MVGDNRNAWTQDQMDRLWALAEACKARGPRMNWRSVPLAIGHSLPSCQNKLAEMRSGARQLSERSRLRALRKTAEKVAPRPAMRVPAPGEIARKAPVENPDYARTTSTAKLVMDAELRSRIEVQGVTAGLLGDPMPGRSALDRKRAGVVDAPPASVLGRPREFSAPVTLATGPLR